MFVIFLPLVPETRLLLRVRKYWLKSKDAIFLKANITRCVVVSRGRYRRKSELKPSTKRVVLECKYLIITEMENVFYNGQLQNKWQIVKKENSVLLDSKVTGK